MTKAKSFIKCRDQCQTKKSTGTKTKIGWKCKD